MLHIILTSKVESVSILEIPEYDSFEVVVKTISGDKIVWVEVDDFYTAKDYVINITRDILNKPYLEVNKYE